jgi:hypothetical protein
VAGAIVRADDAGREARADSAGRFTLGGLPAGTQMVDVVALGYAPARRRVDVGTGAAAPLEVTLRRSVVLATVTARTDATRRFAAALDQRATLGMGVVRQGADLAGRPNAASVLREIPRLVVAQGNGTASVYVNAPGRTCRPDVYLDGQRVEPGTSAGGALSGGAGGAPSRAAFGGNLDQIPPVDQLVAVEVYRSTAGVPLGLATHETECGAVFFWTRQYAGPNRR